MGILTAILGGLLVVAISYIAKSRFGQQPKLHVGLVKASSTHRKIPSGKVKVTWRKKLRIYNFTAFPALEVSFIWPRDERSLPIPAPDPPHIDSLKEYFGKFELVEHFAPETVADSLDKFKDFEPDNLRSFILIIRYKNRYGITFYTRYEKDGEKESCTYHIFKPRK